VLVNGEPLAEHSVSDTRAHILVSEVEPRLFSGALREELAPHGGIDDPRILETLEAVSATDILDALDDGLDAHVEERGRSFSGGERQRLTLARALLADAELLVLVEPTSAVDTHTERRIATRLGALRRHHSTLIATTSPLVLEQVDLVYLIDGGRVVAEGAHQSLIESSSLYRQVVLREELA
jgi:ABC-type multidrug transport system fused ATPase/permease subunit